MAVTPISLATLTIEELAVISRVETTVDAELRLKYEAGKAIAIRNVLIRAVLELSDAVLVEFKGRYSSAGWTLREYSSDEGIWFSFSET